ncbi:MAG: hypothetical protein R3C49_17570 [Planctomycetaceae bacterium]
MALIGAAFGIGFTFGPLIGAACTSGIPAPAANDARYTAVRNWADSSEVLTAESLSAELEQDGQLASADREAILQLTEMDSNPHR